MNYASKTMYCPVKTKTLIKFTAHHFAMCKQTHPIAWVKVFRFKTEFCFEKKNAIIFTYKI